MTVKNLLNQVGHAVKTGHYRLVTTGGSVQTGHYRLVSLYYHYPVHRGLVYTILSTSWVVLYSTR